MLWLLDHGPMDASSVSGAYVLGATAPRALSRSFLLASSKKAVFFRDLYDDNLPLWFDYAHAQPMKDMVYRTHTCTSLVTPHDVSARSPLVFTDQD